MYPEDYLMFTNGHSDPRFNPNPISESAPTEIVPVFPHELLDSGFELTEILTAEWNPSRRPIRGAPMGRGYGI